MKRLGIVVPYRDRKAHLEALIPHLCAYFERDKLDCNIPYRVLVVEQEGRDLLNRGALKNIGFLLLEGACDYVCFHDVDYLPIWTDYSPVGAPTPIAWYGAGLRPIAPGVSNQMIRENLETFFGAVLLVPNDQFRRIDGYANCYWGWGYEDADLKRRFLAAGITPERRTGTFHALPHNNEGFTPDGRRSAIANVNKAIFERRWNTGPPSGSDGLSTVRYEIVQRSPIRGAPARPNALGWEHALVRLLDAPSADQKAAGGRAQSRSASKPQRFDRRVSEARRTGRAFPNSARQSGALIQ